MFKLLILLGRFRWLLLVLPIGFGAIAFATSYALPFQYRTTVIIAGSAQATASVLKSLVESDGVRDRLITSLDLASRYGAADEAGVQRAFAQRVSARPGRDGLLLVTTTDSDPVFAAKLADAIAAETIRTAHAQRLTGSSQEIARLRTRLDAASRETKAADEQLRAMGIADWRTALPEAEREAVVALIDLQAEIEFTGRRIRQGAQNALVLQEQLLALQKPLLDRRFAGVHSMTAPAFELVKGQFFRAATSKRLAQELVLVADDAVDEVKPIAAAPIPLDRDSPKRLVMGTAGFALGLALVAAIALMLGSGDPADPVRAARKGALKRAWGLRA